MKRDIAIGLICALLVYIGRSMRRQSWTAADWVIAIVALFAAVELAHRMGRSSDE